MAILTNDQLGDLRRGTEMDRTPLTHTKTQVNAAFQAIEDRFEAVRASFGTAIETAAPGVFSGPQKIALVKFWLRSKFDRGG